MLSKEEERNLMDLLQRGRVIWPGFMGQIVLHIGPGPALCDIERHTKGLKRLVTNNAIDVEYEIEEKEVKKNAEMGQ